MKIYLVSQNENCKIILKMKKCLILELSYKFCAFVIYVNDKNL